MHSRRKFIAQTGAAALAALLASNKTIAALSALPAPRSVGLQLFTLFNIIDDDVAGNLKKVAALGFKDIESAFSKKGGYYGMKPKEFAAMLKDMGMAWQSHHVLGAPFKLPPGGKLPLDPDGKPMAIPVMRNLRDDMQALVDEAAEGDVKYLVCASTPITTADDVKSSIDVLNKTGEACKKAGIQFAYHNHDAEFRVVEGIIPYDLFLSQTDKDLVKMELDIAWAVKGGKDPIEIFTQNPGRFPLWHVKDLDASHENILPVGSGTITYEAYFKKARLAGMKHFFIEHDMPKDPFDSITKSMATVKKFG